VLAAYVGDSVVIRYDPRDMAEIRVFTGTGFLCRAICPELAGPPSASRTSQPRAMSVGAAWAGGLRERASVVDRLLGAHQEQPAPGISETPAPAYGP
jgi:putative transposase